MSPEQREQRLRDVDERIARATPPSPREAAEYLAHASNPSLIIAVNRLTEAGLAIAAALRVLATPASPAKGAFIVPEREDD